MPKKQNTAKIAKIERKLPPVSSTLTAKFKEQTYTAKIVEAEDFAEGRAVEYDGVRYRSLSAAAKAIAGHAMNGWRFWQIEEPK